MIVAYYVISLTQNIQDLEVDRLRSAGCTRLLLTLTACGSVFAAEPTLVPLTLKAPPTSATINTNIN